MTENENEPMNFRPITEGLGFHPFSNGLPYETNSKSASVPSPNPKRQFQTSGAQPSTMNRSSTSKVDPTIPPLHTSPNQERLASGIPSFSSPKSNSTNSTNLSHSSNLSMRRTFSQQEVDRRLKNATYPLPIAQTPLTQTSTTVGQTSTTKSSPLGTNAPLDTASIKNEVTVSGWVLVNRFIAYSIDLVLMTLVALSTISIALFRINIDPMLLAKKEFLLAIGLYAFLFSWALITAQEILFSTTIGKRLFKLSIHGDASKIFLRSVGFLLSISLFGLGLWSGFISKRKLCFHDILSKVSPVRIPSMKKG